MKIKIVRSKTSGYGYISTLTDSNEFLVCKEISWYENPFKDFLNNHKLSSEIIPETDSYEQGYSFTELNESEQPINEESKIDAIEKELCVTCGNELKSIIEIHRGTCYECDSK